MQNERRHVKVNYMKNILIFLFALVPLVSSGEEFIVFGPAQLRDSTTKIIFMEQGGAGITVVTREENEKELPSQKIIFAGIPSDVVDVEVPSIAINWVLSERDEGSLDRLPGQIFFDVVGRCEALPRFCSDFDFEINDGWVFGIGFGWLNIKHYPWVFHSKLDWFYCSPSEIIEKRNSYWFWNEKFGWIWTQREIFPLVWIADAADWRMVDPRNQQRFTP